MNKNVSLVSLVGLVSFLLIKKVLNKQKPLYFYERKYSTNTCTPNPFAPALICALPLLP